VSALAASYGLWAAWAVSWALAAVWTRRTAARPALVEQLVYLAPTWLGMVLLFGLRPWRGPVGLLLFSLPEWVRWVLTGLVAIGFIFTWWARIRLGSLWSSSVSFKQGHAVVASGPYAIVRHPIYTGLILAAFAFALELGTSGSLAGAALIAFGFWLKARLEERFLSAELGADAYASYRRRTPMLVPFLPRLGRQSG
jgi:protein-S-isoprenylcysteine O-methyltransferase Ste14